MRNGSWCLPLVLALVVGACTDTADDDDADELTDADGDGWSDASDCAPDDPTLPVWTTEVITSEEIECATADWIGERPTVFYAVEGDVRSIIWTGSYWDSVEVGRDGGEVYTPREIEVVSRSSGSRALMVRYHVQYDGGAYNDDQARVWLEEGDDWAQATALSALDDIPCYEQDGCDFGLNNAQMLAGPDDDLAVVASVDDYANDEDQGAWWSTWTDSDGWSLDHMPELIRDRVDVLTTLPDGTVLYAYATFLCQGPWGEFQQSAEQYFACEEIPYAASGKLVVSPNGQDLASVYQGYTQDLVLAVRRDGAWSEHVLDYEGEVGGGAAATFDDQGRIHIFHRDITNEVVKYVRWHESEVISSTLPDVFDEGTEHEALVSPEGLPAFMRYDVNDSADGTTGVDWTYPACPP